MFECIAYAHIICIVPLPYMYLCVVGLEHLILVLKGLEILGPHSRNFLGRFNLRKIIGKYLARH